MNDIKRLSIDSGTATELPGSEIVLRLLQTLMDRNFEIQASHEAS